MSKHNRERREFKRKMKENMRLRGVPDLTAYQWTRIAKHGKRKLR